MPFEHASSCSVSLTSNWHGTDGLSTNRTEHPPVCSLTTDSVYCYCVVAMLTLLTGATMMSSPTSFVACVSRILFGGDRVEADENKKEMRRDRPTRNIPAKRLIETGERLARQTRIYALEPGKNISKTALEIGEPPSKRHRSKCYF
jgi:hypothetical protein